MSIDVKLFSEIVVNKCNNDNINISEIESCWSDGFVTLCFSSWSFWSQMWKKSQIFFTENNLGYLKPFYIETMQSIV